MARQSRLKSRTGIYHVMLKGIDDRNIFLEDVDRIQFLKYLEQTRDENNFSLYAYCLMNNHVHIVMRETSELGNSVKKFTVNYAYYHNKKYERRGHLFNNRYRSEVIETENSLLRVIAYVHNNPINAGITESLNYMWSSHQEYIKTYRNMKSWLNISFIKRYYNTLDVYLNKMKYYEEDSFTDYTYKFSYTDDDLYKFISNNVTTCKVPEIKSLDKKERNLIIKEIKKKTKASNRQISRVLGIGRNIIDRI